MKPKTIIIAFILVLVIAVGSYKYLSRKEELPYDFALVKRGDIIQEVSATGTIKKGEEINLAFKNTGRIEKIYVKVGDEVESDTALAKLNTSQLSIQLQEARAAIKVAQAKLDKLLTGSTLEEIKIAETEVKSSQTSLATAKENLDQAYEDALNTLDDSYLKLYNAYNTVDLIQRTYSSTKVRHNKEYKIKTPMDSAKSYLDIAQAEPTNENIDTALSEMKGALDKTSEALAVIRELCEHPLYRNRVSATDKTSLDNQRSYINTALTNVTSARQTISSKKLSVDSVEDELQKAEDQLTLVKVEPRREDVDLYKAQIEQAQAQINLIENQIQESTIISPTGGQITKINKKLGEMVQPSESIVSLISQDPFQVEVDIPEADIGKINLADSVKITLDAFPETEFSGKVIEIEPAETIIQGVVYYRVKTSLEVKDTKIKPGMTANIIITTDVRENVLIIPQRAIIEKNDKKMVRIPVDKNYQEVEVQTGLRGSEGEIEIISGLKKGDKVVTFMRD